MNALGGDWLIRKDQCYVCSILKECAHNSTFLICYIIQGVIISNQCGSMDLDLEKQSQCRTCTRNFCYLLYTVVYLDCVWHCTTLPPPHTLCTVTLPILISQLKGGCCMAFVMPATGFALGTHVHNWNGRSGRHQTPLQMKSRQAACWVWGWQCNVKVHSVVTLQQPPGGWRMGSVTCIAPYVSPRLFWAQAILGFLSALRPCQADVGLQQYDRRLYCPVISC